ncbi:anti-sigma factor family protein [Paenibacillus mucilaginosus]|uniref:anti-sigma factor family protein n=2 Tax=Paenibacillus mucilaginosus TaxID=61624 RepID=UPI00030B7A24|nr:zf-HC2 domain-containing protein [Paenibacillus mucilaginosus]MCG7218008.1 anti-sigma factor [Paenibacillus mucilaginosus]WDM28563.1 zf-HC2 domain-containing protein [Paenibacillus mucilaginosus]
MNIMHPNEQDLQRYLNNHMTELENRRVRRHLASCPPCRRKLSALLAVELELADLELLEAPAGLSDRVMAALREEGLGNAEAEASRGSGPPGNAPTVKPAKPYWRRELVHGAIAMAATLMFVSSGLVGRLAALDSDRLEAGVRQGTMVWLQTVQTFSQQLLS